MPGVTAVPALLMSAPNVSEGSDARLLDELGRAFAPGG